MNKSELAGHLPFLDGLRGVAILAVFLYHSLWASFGFDQLGWNGLFRDFNANNSFLALYLLTYGSNGVAVFFVISGFCIHMSHQRSSAKGWSFFFNRRFFRIYPPYLAAIFVFLVLWPYEVPTHSNADNSVQLATHVAAVHNLSETTLFGINPSFWSVAVEIQLYLIYPLLLLLASSLGWSRALLLTGISEFSIRLIVSASAFMPAIKPPCFVAMSPFAFWFSWALGAYLYECFVLKRASWIFRMRFDLLLLVGIACPLFKPTAPFTFSVFALATGIALQRLLSGAWNLSPNWLLQKCWQHLGALGVLSYSFYLIHQPIIALNEHVAAWLSPGTPIHPRVLWLACIFVWYPLIFAVSYVMYRGIEKPSIAVSNLLWRRAHRAAV